MLYLAILSFFQTKKIVESKSRITSNPKATLEEQILTEFLQSSSVSKKTLQNIATHYKLSFIGSDFLSVLHHLKARKILTQENIKSLCLYAFNSGRVTGILKFFKRKNHAIYFTSKAFKYLCMNCSSEYTADLIKKALEKLQGAVFFDSKGKAQQRLTPKVIEGICRYPGHALDFVNVVNHLIRLKIYTEDYAHAFINPIFLTKFLQLTKNNKNAFLYPDLFRHYFNLTRFHIDVAGVPGKNLFNKLGERNLINHIFSYTAPSITTTSTIPTKIVAISKL